MSGDDTNPRQNGLPNKSHTKQTPHLKIQAILILKKTKTILKTYHKEFKYQITLPSLKIKIALKMLKSKMLMFCPRENVKAL